MDVITVGNSVHETDVRYWYDSLAKCQYSPGCFGTIEFIDGNFEQNKYKYKLFNIDNLMVLFKKINKKCFYGVISRSKIFLSPINSILGVKNDSNIIKLKEFFRILVKNNEISIQLLDEWNLVLGRYLNSIGFTLVEETKVHVIDLPNQYEDWFKMKGVQRDVIRKANKNELWTELKKINGVEEFYELYKLSNQRWNEKGKSTHMYSIDYFETLLASNNAEYSIYLCYCKESTKPIAGAIIGIIGTNASYLFGAMNINYGYLKPSNYLQSQIINNLIERKINTYILGMSNNDRNIERFKEHLGAKPKKVFVYNSKRKISIFNKFIVTI